MTFKLKPYVRRPMTKAKNVDKVTPKRRKVFVLDYRPASVSSSSSPASDRTPDLA